MLLPIRIYHEYIHTVQRKVKIDLQTNSWDNGY